MRFSKPHLSFESQLNLLIQRGLIVDDHEHALTSLSHINYYRLGSYWWPFIADHQHHLFKQGTKFEYVLNLYNFDRELKLLLLDAIEKIEISVRTQWAYHLSRKYGSHAHLKKEIFNSRFRYDYFLNSIRDAIKRTSDHHIKNQDQKYQEQTPAIWIISEVMSLGLLSLSYNSLKHRAIKNDIAELYHLKETVFSSFLHHITTIRNICAHHARLYNREFTVQMKVPKNADDSLLASLNPQSRRIYNCLVFCAYLMKILTENKQWMIKLRSLIKDYEVNIQDMGFPSDWQRLPIWIVN